MNIKYYDLLFLVLITIINILALVFYFLFPMDKKSEPSPFSESIISNSNFLFNSLETDYGSEIIDNTDNGAIDANSFISLANNSFYSFDLDNPSKGDNVNTIWNLVGTPNPGKFYLLIGTSSDHFLRTGAKYSTQIFTSNFPPTDISNSKNELELTEVDKNVHYTTQFFFTPDNKLYNGYYNQLVIEP